MSVMLKGEVAWLATESLALLRVRPGRPLSIYVTGPVVSYYMHWSREESRTMPCFVCNCPRCLRGDSRRALSYCRVMHFTMYAGQYQWLPAILEIPYSNRAALCSMLGCVVAVKRDRKFGPVSVGKFSIEQPAPKPIAYPLVETLMRMWRVADHQQLALVGDLGTAIAEARRD